MRFETLGEKGRPAVLFFHAMGVVGESSEPVAQFLRERYFCVMPTSSVYCAGERYVSKEDEIRQVEDFLRAQGSGSWRSWSPPPWGRTWRRPSSLRQSSRWGTPTLTAGSLRGSSGVPGVS